MAVRRPVFCSPNRTLWGRFPDVLVPGLLSVAVYVGMAWLSHAFVYGTGHADRPIVAYLSLYAAAFAVYGVAVWSVTRPRTTPTALLPIVVFGVLFRGILLYSEPIQEDDFYRYLWDGKVVASGLNPYRYSPQQVADAGADETGSLQAYRAVADDGFARILSRVNHPHLPTVYPPSAQAAFGLAAMLAPGSLAALRVEFLLLDLGIVAALVGLLRRLRRPVGWVVIYAWSPLVIKETANSTHYDVLPMLLVMLAVWAGLMDDSCWPTPDSGSPPWRSSFRFFSYRCARSTRGADTGRRPRQAGWRWRAWSSWAGIFRSPRRATRCGKGRARLRRNG